MELNGEQLGYIPTPGLSRAAESNSLIGPGPPCQVDTETSSTDINFDKAKVLLLFCMLLDTTV